MSRLGTWTGGWHATRAARAAGPSPGVTALPPASPASSPPEDGPYQGYLCLYWLEVLPAFQGQGIGQALLAWATAQTAGTALLIAATPPSAPFYRRYLTNWTEPTPSTFLVKGGAAQERDERIAA
jgi:GNAT superfamily N-acetyltransferase